MTNVDDISAGSTRLSAALDAQACSPLCIATGVAGVAKPFGPLVVLAGEVAATAGWEP